MRAVKQYTSTVSKTADLSRFFDVTAGLYGSGRAKFETLVLIVSHEEEVVH